MTAIHVYHTQSGELTRAILESTPKQAWKQAEGEIRTSAKAEYSRVTGKVCLYGSGYYAVEV